MTILFDATTFANPATTFGAGILASCPHYHADHTVSDEAWLAADNARRDADNAHLERLAGESAALDLMERGIRPF